MRDGTHRGWRKAGTYNGLPQAYWVAMDFVEVIVHIFIPEARDFYNLENLWEDAKVTNIPNLD